MTSCTKKSLKRTKGQAQQDETPEGNGELEDVLFQGLLCYKLCYLLQDIPHYLEDTHNATIFSMVHDWCSSSTFILHGPTVFSHRLCTHLLVCVVAVIHVVSS